MINNELNNLYHGLPSHVTAHDARLVALNGKLDTSEHLTSLLSVENKFYSPPPNYLSTIRWSSSSPGSPTNDAEPVSEIWRRKLCEWCYEVVDHFGFDREVVFIALNYIDRSVAVFTQRSGSSITRREFQLFAVTSLYIAIKVHGEKDCVSGVRQKLKIDAFVQLSRGFFDIDVIEAKERAILSDLQWHVNPPTTVKFIASYLRLCPKYQPLFMSLCESNILGAIYDVARYLTELSVCVSHFTFEFKTSVIGYAAVLCAIDALQNTSPLPHSVRVLLLNNIAEASNLKSSDPEVVKASMMLKELCPNLFEGNDFPSEFFTNRGGAVLIPPDAPTAHHSGGKCSPVSVSTSHHELEVAAAERRKRSRPNPETGNWQYCDRPYSLVAPY